MASRTSPVAFVVPPPVFLKSAGRIFQLALKAFEKNDFGSALDYCRQILEVQPNNIYVLWFGAISATAFGEREVAKVYLRKLLTIAPFLPRVGSFLALLECEDVEIPRSLLKYLETGWDTC